MHLHIVKHRSKQKLCKTTNKIETNTFKPKKNIDNRFYII